MQTNSESDETIYAGRAAASGPRLGVSGRRVLPRFLSWGPLGFAFAALVFFLTTLDGTDLLFVVGTYHFHETDVVVYVLAVGLIFLLPGWTGWREAGLAG